MSGLLKVILILLVKGHTVITVILCELRKERSSMDIKDLTDKVKEAANKRTPEERAELLRKAHILDDGGNFCKEYFTSKETVKK